MAEVKGRRTPSRTRISSKNQVTLPVDVLRRTGLKPGDVLRVDADGAGRVVLVRDDDVIARYAGDLTGVYEPGYLEKLRDEWR